MTVRERRCWLAVSVVLSLGVWAIAQDQPPAGEPAPRLELSPTTFDFGTVWQSVPVKREFTVKNVGNAELTLSVRSSCGCTLVSNPQSPLLPGATSTFAIQYDTKRAGPASKKVTLTTNDPTQASVDIPVTGMVNALFTMTPAERLTFTNIEPSASERLTMKRENQYHRPLSLKLKPDQQFGRFDIALAELEPGRVYELTAATRPPLNKGWNQTEVQLETGLEEVPVLTVPVAANVQPRVVVFPGTIPVTADAKQPTQRVVSVDYRKDTPLKITGVQTSFPGIQWEILPPEPPLADRKTASQKVRLTLPAFADMPADGASVTILTDDREPAYQQLEVRIMKLSRLGAAPRSGPAPADPDAGNKAAQPGGAAGQ